MFRRQITRALTVAVIGSLLMSTAVFADDANIDGDNATPVAQNPLNFGSEVCLNSTPSKSVLLVLRATGHPGQLNNVFKNSSTVTWTPTASAGLTATTANSTVPATWTSSPNQTLGAQTTSSVTLTTAITGTLGSFSKTVSYAATGVRASDGAAFSKNTGSIAVTGTVINCDDDPPVISVENITVEAAGPGGAVATYAPTASDAAPTSPTVSCTPAGGSTFELGTTTVNCSATDAAGNVGTASFTVTVEDTTAPVVTPATNITREATSAAGAVVTYSGASASDLVDGSITPTCTPASGGTFALGATTVTCEATDDAGNTGQASFTVTVSDTTDPLLTVSGDMTAEATGPSGAAVTFSASATDDVDGDVQVECDPASGSTFALGTTAVDCSATDDSGNSVSASFTITVEDMTAPEVTAPDNITAEATGASGAVVTYSLDSATDLVDGDVEVTCDYASGSTFALGTTTVTCSATDEAGNTGTDTFSITVQDTTAPELQIPADQVVEATSASGATVNFSASATDAVDADPTVECDAVSADTFSLGATLVSCTATDDAGNENNGSFTITVQDTTAPAITVPADMTVEATSGSGATVTYSASASDLVDGSITPTCTPASGGTFALGTTTVTCEATDDAGNTGSKTFTITVQDTTAPAITVPANMTVQGTGINGAVVTYSATATDLVDGAVTPVCSPASGSTFGYGTTTVTCNATDAAGNTSSKSFTVRVTYRMSGFYQPVDMSGTLNIVKAGSTVPLKFEIFAGSTELTTTSSIQSFKVSTTNCSSLGVIGTDDIEVYSTGGTTLRYDTAGGQFIQNWQTPKAVGTCYTVTMTAVDGSTIVAYLKSK